ncbi:MAG: peptide-modifying radical SAM enzyme CbpB [Ferrimicrobium sp.]
MFETLPRSDTEPSFVTIDIGHSEYMAVVEPDTAFWSLIRKASLPEVVTNPVFVDQIRARSGEFADEMRSLRFGLVPSAVYFNPTERCNLNCTYCYLPEGIRRHGQHMSKEHIFGALEVLRDFFSKTMPAGSRPQLIFHGSEPMLNRKAVFAAIDHFSDDFIFGIQTNGTLLDSDAIEFLTSRQISIGLSLDGPIAEIADRTRHTYSNHGVYARVIAVLEALRGYKNYSVICTMTNENIEHLVGMVELLHSLDVPTCMLNPVRLTMPGSRDVTPSEADLVTEYLRALERTYELYEETGRKLVVANFANIVLAIVAPTGRHLMCDISPCGGGRCFFAVDAKGSLFPCSEFIGLQSFEGGNLFSGGLERCFDSDAFRSVTERVVEDIDTCKDCPIRHFCGAPCPAEAYELRGGLVQRGAFCHFYKEQFGYAMRLIADGRENAYLWDNWDETIPMVFEMSSL